MSKQSTSEQISDLEQQLDKLRRIERRVKREAEKRADAALNTLKKDPNIWEWEVTPNTCRSYRDGSMLEGANIKRRIKSHILMQFHEEYGHALTEAHRYHGTFYYRTDEGILDHNGGGTHILNTPKLCSDEEWKEILAGNPAEKFIL